MSAEISPTRRQSQRNISIFELAFLQVDFRVLPISDVAMFDVPKVLLIQLDKPHLAGDLFGYSPQSAIKTIQSRYAALRPTN